MTVSNELLIPLAVVGGLTLVNLGWKLFNFVLGAMKGGKSPTSYGKWVAVTGATDGIGKAMAMEFAKRGMNVFLMSRTESKLKAVQEEIKSLYNVETGYLPVDFSQFDADAQEKVKEALEGLDDLGVLINNVGMSYPFPLYFHELSDEELEGLIELNINATTWMSRIAIPIMLQKKKGLILNIGSGAGLNPNPLLAVYSATKAYVETLSHSLNTEYGPKGIDIQCHVPLFIVSKLSKYKKATAFIPSTETYAKKTMATLGSTPVVSPHLPHRIACNAMNMFPQSLVQWGSLKFHLGIRAKGLKKREREAEGKKTK